MTTNSKPVYFTAPDVATVCAVDTKTIHNWVDKDRIRHFRTPGGHLRFRPADVVAFLEHYGYDVPAKVRDACPAVT